MTTPTFIPGIGRLALDRYDFKDHVDGYASKHNADDITVIPGITFTSGGLPQTDVYSSLTSISAELADLALSGKGFILVGDGYDTYANSLISPDAPYDSLVPPLDPYLNDVLNNPNNPLYFRIRDGGVVMIKAGTYKFTGNVAVPAGIILLGEGYGTKIVNQTSSPTALFTIKSDSARIPDGGVDSVEKFIFCRETMLINLTIADNFLVPTFLGDLSYKDPQNNNSVVPLVYLEEGASLSCENVRFVGKSTYSLGAVSDVTSFAIATNSAVPSSTGTRLKVFNCSVDGFSVPIKFTASGGYNDNIIISNTLMRGYGFLNSDFAAASNNTILKLNACNANISNNYFFGYDDTVTSLAFITLPVSPPPRQSLAKVSVAGNNIAIKRASATENTTFQLIRFNTSVANDICTMTVGNNFNGIAEIDAGLISRIRQVSGNYTVDSVSADYLLLVDTSSAPVTINLPTHRAGRTLQIKDAVGNAQNNSITLARNASVGSIDNYEGDRLLSTNWASWTLVSNGTNWYIV